MASSTLDQARIWLFKTYFPAIGDTLSTLGSPSFSLATQTKTPSNCLPQSDFNSGLAAHTLESRSSWSPPSLSLLLLASLFSSGKLLQSGAWRAWWRPPEIPFGSLHEIMPQWTQNRLKSYSHQPRRETIQKQYRRRVQPYDPAKPFMSRR